jgi:hypothetical protein
MSAQIPRFLLDLDTNTSLRGEIDGVSLEWGTPSTSSCSAGVRALMLAVLEEAIQSFLSVDIRAREEAERWIANPLARSPFSFTVVCETLGLEPAAARRALHGMRSRNGGRKTLSRSRPNVRRVSRLPGRKTA